jgi:integrase
MDSHEPVEGGFQERTIPMVKRTPKRAFRIGRIVSDSEIQSYLAAAHPDVHDFAKLILELGLHPGEVCQLRRTDVDLKANTVRIQKRLDDHNKPGRRLLLTPETKEILSQRMHGRSAWIFPSPDRVYRPRTKLTALHKIAVAKANLTPFTLGDLLCTFEASRLAAGMSRQDLTKSLRIYRNFSTASTK